MCSPTPPAAPDYTGAAEATAAGNLALAQQATAANRPDQYNPWGTTSWEQTDPVFDEAKYQAALEEYQAALEEDQARMAKEMATQMADSRWYNLQSTAQRADARARRKEPRKEDYMTPGKWTQRTTLTPELQAILDKNIGLQSTLADLGIKTGDYLKDIAGKPIDFGTYEGSRSSVMDAMLSRVNEQISSDREAKAAQLAARGIPQGSEAWNREMQQLDRQLTDARQQAEIASTGMALNERQRQVQEALLSRQTPLNEMAAYRSGSQVQMPQFQPFAAQGMTSGPDYLGATQAQGAYDMNTYNAEVAQRNALMQGLFGLGAAYIGG